MLLDLTLTHESINRQITQLNSEFVQAYEEQYRALLQLTGSTRAAVLLLTSSTKERLEALEKERATLKANIAHAQMQRPVYTKDQIVRWMSRFKEGRY